MKKYCEFCGTEILKGYTCYSESCLQQELAEIALAEMNQDFDELEAMCDEVINSWIKEFNAL